VRIQRCPDVAHRVVDVTVGDDQVERAIEIEIGKSTSEAPLTSPAMPMPARTETSSYVPFGCG
jgi:hypothetical protein